jgi:DNA-binding LacI/PurR family transcriptional regulator
VQLLHGVASVCEERELALSLVPRIPGRDAALVQSALVDGFVVYCMGDDDPRLDAILERRLPYALIDHAPGSAERTVNIDDREAARATAAHLTALGHRRFGIVLGWDNPHVTAAGALQAMHYHVDRARLGGWRDALEAAGVEWGAVALASASGFTRETGRAAGGKLLDRADRPTAILALSDLQALGVLRAAAERGIDVPGDLSVVGFDDIPQAAAATPALTTVSQPHEEKGRAAVRLLVAGADPADSVLLPCRLVVRASTGPAPN